MAAFFPSFPWESSRRRPHALAAPAPEVEQRELVQCRHAGVVDGERAVQVLPGAIGVVAPLVVGRAASALHLQGGQRHQRGRVREARVAHRPRELGDRAIEAARLARQRPRQRRPRRVEPGIPRQRYLEERSRLRHVAAPLLHEARVVAGCRRGPGLPSGAGRAAEEESDRVLAGRRVPVTGALVARHRGQALGELLLLRGGERRHARGRRHRRRRPRRAPGHREAERAQHQGPPRRRSDHRSPRLASKRARSRSWVAGTLFGYRHRPCSRKVTRRPRSSSRATRARPSSCPTSRASRWSSTSTRGTTRPAARARPSRSPARPGASPRPARAWSVSPATR